MSRASTRFEHDVVRSPSDLVFLGDEIASGREGTVYELREEPELVAKLFDGGVAAEKHAKVRAMAATRPADPTRDRASFPALAWPQAPLYDARGDGSFVGYLMPRLETERYESAQRDARERLAHDESAFDDRLRTALNLALTVDLVHEQGHAVGDLNHENVLVADGRVTLIDCDSFHVTAGDDAHAGATTHPRYAPPEGRGNDLAAVQRADRFGLAVHLFQFLMGGHHPFVATGADAAAGDLATMVAENEFPYRDPRPGRLEPPDYAPQYGDLPAELRTLFERCFGYGKRRPSARPTAREWVRALRRVRARHSRGVLDRLRRALPWTDASVTEATARTPPETGRRSRDCRSARPPTARLGLSATAGLAAVTLVVGAAAVPEGVVSLSDLPGALVVLP